MTSWTEDEIELLEDSFYTSTKRELEDKFNRSYDSVRRKAYRLNLERHKNISRITAVKEGSRIDLNNINKNFANFVCGFVAGEGTFTYSHRPTGTTRYRFCIQLANDDREILEDIKEMFGCGSLNEYDSRREGEKGSVSYQIGGYGDIVNRVIPFFDEYGLHSSRKQRQYNEWRRNVLQEISTERFKWV